MTRLASVMRILRARRFGLGVLCTVWILGAFVLFFGAYNLQYTLTNIDGIQYIRIAEHYFAGRFDDGLNAYWSPMISWSMLPFMASGMASQMAFYMASAVWSVVGVAVGTLFVWKYTGRNLLASLVIEGVLLALYTGNLLNTTPDLLSVTWVMMFAWALVKANAVLDQGTNRQKWLWGSTLGVVMAFGYFSKAYLVPVFAVSGLGWLVIRLLATRRDDLSRPPRVRRKSMLVLPLAALVSLVVVVAPFVSAISVKYGGFTIGSSFAVNTQFKGDPVQEPQANTLSLPPPPNDYAISFGEDRTAQLYLHNERRSESLERSALEKAVYYLEQRVKALPLYLSKLTAIMPFGVPIVGGFLLLVVFGVLDPRRHGPALITAGIGLVYFLGYLAITNGEGTGGHLRYYWPMLPLSTAVACLLWPRIWAHVGRDSRWWRRWLAVGLIALQPIAAVSQLDFGKPQPFSTQASLAGLGYLLTSPVKSDKQIFAEHLLATGVIEPGSKIVSGTAVSVTEYTLQYAFYMRVQIYGRREPHDITDPRFQAVLRADGIDYYFLYEPREDQPMDVSAWGHVKATYDMGFTCGLTSEGAESSGCRLSIVAVDP